MKQLFGIRDGKQISFGPFSALKLPIQCTEEQEKIADFLNTIDQKITAEESKLKIAKEWKKGLLQRMFV